MLNFVGPFAVYFNRHCDAPLVWIVAARNRSWEVNVATVAIDVPIATAYEPQPHPENPDGPPSAYFVGTGLVVVDDQGNANITSPAMARSFALRIAGRTQHGPGGRGGPGPCDGFCLKCEDYRELEREMARGRR